MNFSISVLSYFKTILIILTGLSFGLRFYFVGTLYLGDIILSLSLVFCLIRIFMGKLKLHPEAMVCLLLPVFGSVLDLINYVPTFDLFRGLARNGIFASSVVVGSACVLRFGFLTTWYLYVSVCISLVGWGIVYDPYVINNLVALVKYQGGSYSIMALQTLLRKLSFVSLITAFLFSILCVVYLDSRGVALIWSATGLSVIGVYFGGAFVYRRYFLLHVTAIFTLLLGLGVVNYSEFTEIEARRDESDRLRLDMAYDSLIGFKERPLVGNGSWQHARVYIDLNDPTLETGVHSYVLQLAYEYGLFGLLLAMFIMFLLFHNYRSVLEMYVRKTISFFPFFMLTYLYIYIVYNLVNSPFGGYSRILVGMAIGILITSGRSNRSLQS